jgi:serine/threonine protein kinase
MEIGGRTGSLHGKRFGNYIAHQRVGQGGMGSVYKAVHPEIGREVAIKVLARHHNEEMLQRFLEEARTIARIGHPNIVDIFDFGRTHNDRLYYVMEWLEGRELREVMNERIPMTPDEITPFLEQICAGLQAAHDSGVIHRDLKPANIFVLNREPLAVKVLDFGVAKLLDAPVARGITSPGIMIGTPMFCSPEQASAELDKMCPQTDLYGLGIILYWMLTGQPPFMAESNAVLLAMHIADTPKPIQELMPTVPVGITELVESCLAKAPKDRPASADGLIRAWKAALGKLAAVGDRPAEKAYDDGPSGILVFVPVTPVEEVVPTEVGALASQPGEPEAVVTLPPLVTGKGAAEVPETPTAPETPAGKKREPAAAASSSDPAESAAESAVQAPPSSDAPGATQSGPAPATPLTPKRAATPWLPWVLMALAVAVAVALALIR